MAWGRFDPCPDCCGDCGYNLLTVGRRVQSYRGISANIIDNICEPDQFTTLLNMMKDTHLENELFNARTVIRPYDTIHNGQKFLRAGSTHRFCVVKGGGIFPTDRLIANNETDNNLLEKQFNFSDSELKTKFIHNEKTVYSFGIGSQYILLPSGNPFENGIALFNRFDESRQVYEEVLYEKFPFNTVDVDDEFDYILRHKRVEFRSVEHASGEFKYFQYKLDMDRNGSGIVYWDYSSNINLQTYFLDGSSKKFCFPRDLFFVPVAYMTREEPKAEIAISNSNHFPMVSDLNGEVLLNKSSSTIFDDLNYVYKDNSQSGQDILARGEELPASRIYVNSATNYEEVDGWFLLKDVVFIRINNRLYSDVYDFADYNSPFSKILYRENLERNSYGLYNVNKDGIPVPCNDDDPPVDREVSIYYAGTNIYTIPNAIFDLHRVVIDSGKESVRFAYYSISDNYIGNTILPYAGIGIMKEAAIDYGARRRRKSYFCDTECPPVNSDGEPTYFGQYGLYYAEGTYTDAILTTNFSNFGGPSVDGFGVTKSYSFDRNNIFPATDHPLDEVNSLSLSINDRESPTDEIVINFQLLQRKGLTTAIREYKYKCLFSVYDPPSKTWDTNYEIFNIDIRTG